ncbi:tudor domain-containing protein 7A [Clinocottus analis]|uniref:tudor domain-containing protein 7A n=1 Tax=Clinocottus analis TaxID=304258 RepID=UPI0035BF9A2D
MSDSESIKKMLRSVLQSSKSGVSMHALQSEYRSLCGESIPLRELGHSRLEDYLRSISSVVRLEYHMGEIKCFAAVCKETAHIAELVAKQKSSKKAGRSHVVNCKMRFKPSNPYMLNVRPGPALRQPSAIGSNKWHAHRYKAQIARGSTLVSAPGDYRQLDQSLSVITPVERRLPASQPTVKPCFMPDRNEKNLTNCQKSREPFTEKPPVQVSRLNQSQSGLYDVELMQSRITQLLKKYRSGLWLTKLPRVYSDMFNEKLHPQVLIDLEKWSHIAMVEQPSCTNRADRLIYPPLPPKPRIVPQKSDTNMPPTSPTDSKTITTLLSSHPSTPDQPSMPSLFPVPKPRLSHQPPLARPTFIFPPQPAAAPLSKLLNSVTLRSPARNPALAPHLPSCVNLALKSRGDCKQNPNMSTMALNHNQNILTQAPTVTSPASPNAPSLASSNQAGPENLPFLKVDFSPTSDSVPCPSLKPSAAVVVSAEVRQKIKELLSKYCRGLWAHSLPKLFMDTYKMQFPKHILDNLSLLPDTFTVEYPIPHDKKKAILYNSKSTDMEATQNHVGHPLPSGMEVLGPVVPPCLVLPSEQYPSVLIADAKRSNAVTIRYVGENYSDAQEAMEEAMHSFYNQSSTHHPLSKPVVGQLVAVRGEDGEEVARAQVIAIIAPNKVKVYYVDYGFSVETSGTNLLELHQDFLSLPFQAIFVGLAGLEAFSSYPPVLSSLDKLIVGKIMLMETLESCQQNETPVVVLYDTSQDDDININSTCLKTLQDLTMSNPLTVNATYPDVRVTNVCADGVIYCQLPCRGTARLCKLLEETESFFISQMTSELLVSRPFIGKFCLARYNGMWSRVEITNIYGNRVIEILFIDLGVPATVEVTDLREIPPLLIKNFTIIPPLAIKCRLADVAVPEGDWSPEAVLWLKKAILGSEDCKIKILKLDEHKEDRLVDMYLFIGAVSQELDKSFNHQLAQSDLWKELTTQKNNNNNITCTNSGDTGLSALIERLTLGSPVLIGTTKSSTIPLQGAEASSAPDMMTETLSLPPPLELPQPGQNMDVFVPVACHPGYFVVQPWQDLHKLVVLMGEMMLYYNQTWKTNSAPIIQKGQIYAAKIDKNWNRVQVKGILANGLVSVFDLDYGQHEVLRNTLFRPLIEEFRQLPFQAITTQLAGMTQHQWSEEASMLFRNHVEKHSLVAQVESVSEVKRQLWQCRMTVYLVDTTTHKDQDIWIHSMMEDFSGELSSAA